MHNSFSAILNLTDTFPSYLLGFKKKLGLDRISKIKVAGNVTWAKEANLAFAFSKKKSGRSY